MTAIGRTRLLTLIHGIGDDKVIYCDTDSVIFNGDEKDVLRSGIKIGDDHGMIASAIG